MNPLSMNLLGRALADYYNGDKNASVTLCRDDGLKSELPISVFFSELKDFPELEKTALDLCRGTILDVGAGAGRHSLELQKRGFDIQAIDISNDAAEIMKKRGVKKAECSDVYSVKYQAFDTVLLLMHGMGIAETKNNLEVFLKKLVELLKKRGQILVNSIDVTKTNDPVHIGYQKKLMEQGKYRGDIRMRLEYKGEIGAWYNWLQLEPGELSKRCEKAGLECVIVFDDGKGDYLARVSKLYT